MTMSQHSDLGNLLEESDDRGIDGPIPSDADEELGRGDLDPPDYPGASRFVAAANHGRWKSARPRPIDLIVIHITDGNPEIRKPIGHFQKPTTMASPHYIVGQDGEVVQMVRNMDVAWHAKAANPHSIGIEHVARSPKELSKDDPGFNPTQVQYESSARLVRWLCRELAIPIDRQHIKGHCEAAVTTHSDCPNRIWDWDGYMALLLAEDAGPTADK